MRALAERHHAGFHGLMERSTRVVALCEWARAALAANGVAAEKIRVVPHGVNLKGVEKAAARVEGGGKGKLRLAALGRLEPTKGMDVLARAMAELPDASMTLDIYGIAQEDGETEYGRALREQAARDGRIRLMAPAPHGQVISLLSRYDMLAVPSQWMETGPLVVLEAFAAGIPVLGSNLGGIAEKVRDGVDGLLVEWGETAAWREALRRLTEERGLVEGLRANVRPPRTIETMAEEMRAVYEEARGG
jgi:glycosyltransferase involved in cell wall biosynthesis